MESKQRNRLTATVSSVKDTVRGTSFLKVKLYTRDVGGQAEPESNPLLERDYERVAAELEAHGNSLAEKRGLEFSTENIGGKYREYRFSFRKAGNS
ncbi:hypothetical protein HY995_03545 [Candidatus Micrarchaeota archaeon]|nr:hypothetical protein [Candidatus Micrarchaeota archaeon]MBI5177134.1 hypothetical protein [Candidatus Micrarchaeota archaeon]